MPFVLKLSRSSLRFFRIFGRRKDAVIRRAAMPSGRARNKNSPSWYWMTTKHRLAVENCDGFPTK
jgi:hypothetical protein